MLNLKLPMCSLIAVVGLTVPVNLSAANIYTTVLAGFNEVPPNASPGTGNSMVTVNGNILTVNETFSGLTVPASAAHIHCCGPVGSTLPVVLPFTGFPAATSGTYNQSFDLTLASTYTTAFITASGGTATGAQTALINGLNAGQAYANIHNATFPGGEIRGQLASVPEPATSAFMLIGLISMVALAGKRLRHS